MTTTNGDFKWERAVYNDEEEIKNVKKKIDDQLSETIKFLEQAHNILGSTYIQKVKESLVKTQENIKREDKFPFNNGSRNFFGDKKFAYTYEQYMLYINREISKYLNRKNDLIKKENIDLKKQLKSCKCNKKKQSTAGKKTGNISDKYLVDKGNISLVDNGLIF